MTGHSNNTLENIQSFTASYLEKKKSTPPFVVYESETILL